MQFPFRYVSIARPGVRSRRARPIMLLTVHGHGGTVRTLNVLIDTGADEVLLPNHLLAPLGFDSAAGRTRRMVGVGGRPSFRYFGVELELSAGPADRVRWRTTAGFGPVPPTLGLFGIAGGLEFFHLSLSVIDGWFSLHPHPLLPAVPPTAYPHTPHTIP